MKVLKFGGTSVGTVNSLRNVKEIVDNIPGKAVIVVSALGGLTDKLINTAKIAATGDEKWIFEMKEISSRHFQIIDEIISPEQKKEVKEKITGLLHELKRNYDGVFLLRNLPEKTLDIIVSFGERMSSVIVAAMVKNGKRYYSPDFIKTEKWYGKNIADRKLTQKLIQENLGSLEDEEKAIVPGFISADSSTGEITNLGRGGSDFTGALIAAALNAHILEIWTDVDGFMTADPRVVKEAIIIDHLTFTESMELCTFGAKVIYPPTIYPVFHNNIPIKILNTFNPTAPGTLINDHSQPEDLEIKGVTALKGISLVSLDILARDKAEEISKRAFNILSRNAITIIPVANPNPEIELNFAIPSSDAEKAVKLLKEEFSPEFAHSFLGPIIIKDNLAAIALVGKDMKSKGRLSARIGHTLRRNGINVEAYVSGNSTTTLIYLINQEKCDVALPLIHSLVY